jgi:hypothetical protein
MGTYVGGDVSEWKCVSELWGYPEVLKLVEKMKYPEVNEMWYDIDGSFKEMSDDKGASEMEDWAEATDKIHLYLIHPVSQPEFVNLIELEANAFEAQMSDEENYEAQVHVDVNNETQYNVNHEAQFEAQYNVNHKAQFEAQSNFEELGSDEGNASVTSLEDSDDDHILEGEVFIYEIVDSEPKKKSKNKGGRLKRQNVTNPKGKGIVKVNNEIEESDHESRDDLSLTIGKKWKRTLTVSGEEHDSSNLDCENDESDDGTKVHYPPFVMPKKMLGYKLVKGTTFSTREEFKNAISTYYVVNNVDLRYIKNDKERVRVGCKDGCPWIALLSPVPGEDTWQLRKINYVHKCIPEYIVRLLNSDWLGNKLFSNVRDNPNIKVTNICSKAHEKWSAGVSRMKAYRARKAAIALVVGRLKSSIKGCMIMDMKSLDPIHIAH